MEGIVQEQVQQAEVCGAQEGSEERQSEENYNRANDDPEDELGGGQLEGADDEHDDDHGYEGNEGDDEGDEGDDEDGEDDEDDEDDDDNDDDEEEDIVPGWEPPPVHPSDDFPLPMDEDNDAPALDRDMRQRSELQASGKTIVVHFPSAEAGKVYADHGEGPDGSRRAYAASVGITKEEPYAPFKSRLDWEVARWAKLRGPGATAVTDLLKIENVSSLVYGRANGMLTEWRDLIVGVPTWAILQDITATRSID